MPTPDEKTRPCTNCGYDLRGLPGARKCPECGRRQRRWRGARVNNTLARESYRVILACLWRSVLSLVSFSLVVIAIILGTLYGGDTLLWCLALTPFPLAVSTIVRGSRSLVEPGSRENTYSKRFRQGTQVAGLLLLGVGVVTVVLAASGGTGWTFLILLLAGILSVVVASAGVWVFLALDDWTRDDRAERLHGLALWMLVLVGVGLPAILKFLGILTGSTATPFGVAFIGVLIWWLLVVLGDASVLSSVVWCLRHRMHYNEIEHRQEERSQRSADEIRRRIEAMDKGGD